MKRVVCVAVAASLLAGCSNYVGQIDNADVRLEDPPPLNRFEDGEKYVRAVRTKFKQKADVLEAQDQFLKGGIIGGGILALVGIVNKAPRSALNGAAIGGGTFAYGQTLNPDGLRRLYFLGDQSLVCILEVGTNANLPANALEKFANEITMQANNLAVAITEFQRSQTTSARTPEAVTALNMFEQTIRETRLAMIGWMQNGAVVARRMATAANTVVADINLAVQEASPTLASLRVASTAAQLSFPAPKVAPTQADDAAGSVAAAIVTFRNDAAQPAPARSALAILNKMHADLIATNQVANTYLPRSVPVPMASFESCMLQIEGGTSALTFATSPAQIPNTVGAIMLLTINGGRAPYFWAPDGDAVTLYDVTQLGTGADSATFQIKRKAVNGTAPATTTGTLVFSSTHPRSKPQSFAIPSGP